MPVLLESWTITILKPILEDIQGGIGELFGLSLLSATSTPDVFSNDTWKIVDTVSTALIQSSALIILLILTMLELQKSLLTIEGDGEARLRLTIMAGVKFGLVWALFKQTPAILKGIYDAFNDLAIKTNLLFESKTSKNADLNPLFQAVNDLDWLGQTLLVVLMLLAWLIYKGACLGGLALIVMRFVKLYMYGAFAPVPMSFLISDHTRSYGIKFLHNYASAALQAFVIIMALGIYRLLSLKWTEQAVPSLDSGGVAAAFQLGSMYMFMGLVLGMLLMGSGKIASEMLGG